MEEFNKLLEEYSGNYVQFLTTGLPDYERAYKRAQDLIETKLTEKRQALDKEKKDMKHFVESYKDDNNELSTMFDFASTMYKDAQSIQDEYETSKQRYREFSESSQPLKSVDVSNGYKLLLRIGLILIMIPVIFILGYYLMQNTSTSTLSEPTTATPLA